MPGTRTIEGLRELRLGRDLEHALLDALQQQLVHDGLHYAVPLPRRWDGTSALHWVCVELWAPPLAETLRRGVSEELTWSTTPEEGAPAIVLIVDHASRVHLILRWQ